MDKQSGDPTTSSVLDASPAVQPDALVLARALLNATSDAMVVTDADRRVTAYNRRYAQIWGFPPGLLEACCLAVDVTPDGTSAPKVE